MPNCGLCHKCGTPLKEVLDGEQWCSKCETYQRYHSHGFAGAIFTDKTTCEDAAEWRDGIDAKRKSIARSKEILSEAEALLDKHDREYHPERFDENGNRKTEVKENE